MFIFFFVKKQPDYLIKYLRNCWVFFVKIVETKMKEFWWQNLACQIMFHYYQTAEDVRYVKKDLFWQTKTNPRKNVNFLEKVALWWKNNKKWAKKDLKLVKKIRENSVFVFSWKHSVCSISVVIYRLHIYRTVHIEYLTQKIIKLHTYIFLNYSWGQFSITWA